jgi:phage tail sheath protein FI
MPVQLSYPGVYVEEVPSGVRTITGVATSITAFIGRALRGPTTDPVTLTSYGDFERIFGGLWKDSMLGFSVRDFFLNGGSTAVVVRLYKAETGGAAKPGKAVLKFDNNLTLEAKDEGLWGSSLRARVDTNTRPFDASLGETATSLFNLYVRDGTTGVIEEHRNLVVTPVDHPRFVTKVLANESHLVTVSAVSPTTRPGASGDLVQADIDAGRTVWDDGNANATSAKVAGAGSKVSSDGLAITSAEFIGGGFEAAKKGLFTLEKADLFNLLVIPPYKADSTIDTTVVTAADRYCQKRRAMQIVDSLPTWDETSDVTGAFTTGFDSVLGTNSKNAALFFPRVKQPNPLKDNQVETFAAGGTVAGVIARTDASRGVWKAPAGLDATLNGVPELSVPLTDAEIGLLNPLGVNCLRAMPGAGRLVWGARTMRGADLFADEWKYLPVRRTALFLEESLFRGTQWVVFEPNDEPLWAQIRLNLGTFMNNLFRQGAFQGSTPREAYFVKCDKETTTQADIDLGIVNIHVGFAPLKPAEFVVIRLQQIAGQTAA